MKLLFPIILALLFAGSAAAQAPSWERLIDAPTNERTALYNRQESELKLLIQIQQVALQSVEKHLARDVVMQHGQEREKMTTRHSAERSELAKLHQEERRGFRERPDSTRQPETE